MNYCAFCVIKTEEMKKKKLNLGKFQFFFNFLIFLLHEKFVRGNFRKQTKHLPSPTKKSCFNVSAKYYRNLCFFPYAQHEEFMFTPRRGDLSGVLGGWFIKKVYRQMKLRKNTQPRLPPSPTYMKQKQKHPALKSSRHSRTRRNESNRNKTQKIPRNMTMNKFCYC